MPTNAQNNIYYNQDIEPILKEFNSNPKYGLDSKQVNESLEKYGQNILGKVKRSFYKVIIAPVINLLIIIYLISAILTLIIGQILVHYGVIHDANRNIPIFIIVAFNFAVAIIQQYRAEKKLEALQRLSQSSATVIREGKLMKISAEKIVVGDILKLRQGDKVPADARIISSSDFTINESSLTGESEPVQKQEDGDAIKGENISLQDQKNMVFMGTFVASGDAEAIVVKVGGATEIGKISSMLEQLSTGDIPLRKKMNYFAKYLAYGVLILLIFSVIHRSILLNLEGLLTPLNFLKALYLSIDLAMKVMPINLPLITTIILLTGVLSMTRSGVIVRDISKTESLGRVSVVCCDKTGTLTKNEMTVVTIWSPDGTYEVSGKGYSPDGKIIDLDSIGKPIEDDKVEELIISGYLNNNCSITQEEVSTLLKDDFKIKWNIIGLPTEAALRVLAQKYKPNIKQIVQDYEFITEFHFNSKLKRMSKLFKYNNKYYLFSKGATEILLPLCTYFKKEDSVQKMTDIIRKEIIQKMERYAKGGFRILSIASRTIPEKLIPEDYKFTKSRDSIEKDLTYLGFVVIYDPPRDDVYDSLMECKMAGINVVMITGDNLSTGTAIARMLEIYVEGQNIAAEGKDIKSLSDEEFEKVACFARVSPIHKQIIVERYQKMGKIVSMSGDGVNDALALSMADCGLAMGIQGTEVAKEAADMIITDDSFSTIITGIREGRSLFEKIRVVIYFFVCISVMEAIILFSSTLGADPFFEMFHYWQLNFVYITAHVFPTIGFILGNIPKDIMKEKPRGSAEIITKNIFKLMLWQMFFIGISIVLVYYLTFKGIIGVSDFNLSGIGYGDPTDNASNAKIKARTMTLLVLFISESLLMPFQIRRLNNSFKESIHDVEYKEWGFYTTALIILTVCIYVLPIQQIMGEKIHFPLNFMYLDGIDWLIVIVASIIPFMAFEFIRRIARKKEVFF